MELNDSMEDLTLKINKISEENPTKSDQPQKSQYFEEIEGET
jgi:hypothetical protein